MSAPTAAVVIVSYNTRALTLDCIAKLRNAASGITQFEIIVVDNDSDDGSADAIARRFPDVRLIRLTENVGWGRAVNRAAMISEAEYLLLLNPDTEPVGDVVADLVGFAREHPGRGIYTGRTLTRDGVDDRYSCWGLPTVWSHVCFAVGLSTAFRDFAWANPEGLPGYDRSTVREVPAVSGCLMLVERRLFYELGGFDPQFFLYSEDIDLCARARRLGARPTVYPGAAVVHVGGASSSSEGQRTKILRGKVTYARRHWSSQRASVAAALLTIGVLLRAIVGSLLSRQSPRSTGWGAIWRVRHVWLAGWPPINEPRPGPADGVTREQALRSADDPPLDRITPAA